MSRTRLTAIFSANNPSQLDILQRMIMAANLVKIFDLDEIWRHSVISPPALTIHGKLLCQDRTPTSATIEQSLRDPPFLSHKKWLERLRAPASTSERKLFKKP
jgi:hypothetical protein